MGKGYLLDTNFVVYYIGGIMPKDTRALSDRIFRATATISVISKIELLSWQRTAEQTKVKSFVDNAEVISLSDEVVTNTIIVRKTLKKSMLPDAIIAATAITFDLTLVTRNQYDFAGIPNLKIINPFSLK